MTPRPAALERELERLLTLSRADIDRACTDMRARGRLIEFCIDEEIELREAAADARELGDEEYVRHCEQEASAWRHTARVLRTDISADAASARSTRLA